MSLDVSGHNSSHMRSHRRRKSLDNSQLKKSEHDPDEERSHDEAMDDFDSEVMKADAHVGSISKSNSVASKLVKVQPTGRPSFSRAKSAMALSNFRNNAMKNNAMSGSQRFFKKNNCLDLDNHESTHSRKSVHKSMNSSGHRRTEFSRQNDAAASESGDDTIGDDTAGEGSGSAIGRSASGRSNQAEVNDDTFSDDDFSDSEYSTSIDTSCDTFGEADENSAADKEYMMKDLGASFMGNDLETLTPDEMKNKPNRNSDSNPVPSIINLEIEAEELQSEKKVEGSDTKEQS